MKTARVLLADDHALVRAGIRSLLEKMSGIEVVAEAGDGYEALELTKKHFPNVVLMDIAIPGLNGLEALARATKEFPAVKVIILSMHANEEYVLRALRAGACGYLLEGCCGDRIGAGAQGHNSRRDLLESAHFQARHWQLLRASGKRASSAGRTNAAAARDCTTDRRGQKH